ncbi:hypothetical protein B0H12DRAFT_1240596 [Mycena haematopus]|nr:hypothetical protein B0H12DRAFT_1240596 [Mycena haematopus]
MLLDLVAAAIFYSLNSLISTGWDWPTPTALSPSGGQAPSGDDEGGYTDVGYTSWRDDIPIDPALCSGETPPSTLPNSTFTSSSAAPASQWAPLPLGEHDSPIVQAFGALTPATANPPAYRTLDSTFHGFVYRPDANATPPVPSTPVLTRPLAAPASVPARPPHTLLTPVPTRPLVAPTSVPARLPPALSTPVPTRSLAAPTTVPAGPPPVHFASPSMSPTSAPARPSPATSPATSPTTSPTSPTLVDVHPPPVHFTSPTSVPACPPPALSTLGPAPPDTAPTSPPWVPPAPPTSSSTSPSTSAPAPPAPSSARLSADVFADSRPPVAPTPSSTSPSTSVPAPPASFLAGLSADAFADSQPPAAPAPSSTSPSMQAPAPPASSSAGLSAIAFPNSRPSSNAPLPPKGPPGERGRGRGGSGGRGRGTRGGARARGGGGARARGGGAARARGGGAARARGGGGGRTARDLGYTWLQTYDDEGQPIALPLDTVLPSLSRHEVQDLRDREKARDASVDAAEKDVAWRRSLLHNPAGGADLIILPPLKTSKRGAEEDTSLELPEGTKRVRKPAPSREMPIPLSARPAPGVADAKQAKLDEELLQRLQGGKAGKQTTTKKKRQHDEDENIAPPATKRRKS